MLKNAFLYITRKKTKFIIVLTLFIVILVSIYSCLVINKYNGKLEEIMYKSSNSSFLITENNEGLINLKDIEKIKDISGIEKYNYIYEAIAKLKDKDVYNENKKIEISDLNPEYKNVLKIYGVINSELNNEFLSEVFKLVKGRHISKDDVNKVMVHEDLARQNKYNIGDKISLSQLNPYSAQKNEKNSDKKENTTEYEIIGIFSGRKQEKYTGLSSDYSENMVFADYNSTQKINKEKQINQSVYFVKNPKEMDEIIEKAKANKIDWNNISLEKNTKAFDESITSVSSIKGIIRIMTYSIIIRRYCNTFNDINIMDKRKNT